jgi:ribosomal protein L33
MRDVVLLICQECKNKNYSFTKNKKGQTGNLRLKNTASMIESILYIKKPKRELINW